MCKDRGALHQRIRKTFGFPDYYGERWDIMRNCLADVFLQPVQRCIIVEGFASIPQELREYTADYRHNKTCGRSQKETPSVRVVFLFGMPRAGWSLLPRLARSAQAKTPPFRAAFLSAAAAAYPCQYRPGDNSWFTARGACCSTPDRRCSAGRQRHRAPRLRPRSWGWCCCRRW